MIIMNETLKTIHNLRSIRSFSDREISQDILESIIDASLRAASSSARQPYSIIVIEDHDLLTKFFYGGNKALVYCIDLNRIAAFAQYVGKDWYAGDIVDFVTCSTDTILAAQTAVLAGKSLGVDSLITNVLHRTGLEKVYEILNLPDHNVFPLITLSFGYAKSEPPFQKGRARTGIVHYGRYQEMTPEEIKGQVDFYSRDENHMMLFVSEEKLHEKGFKNYFEWFFTEWWDGKSSFNQDFYSTLTKMGFLKNNH
ncbi:hypothetical protein WKT22_00908 [Candidatus Lokiarchaeum ossiferum]